MIAGLLVREIETYLHWSTHENVVAKKGLKYTNKYYEEARRKMVIVTGLQVKGSSLFIFYLPPLLIKSL